MSHSAKPLDFSPPQPSAGGDMETRIRTFDWSRTPLGPLSAWPQSLRTVVNILLSSRYAMWMAWGPELTFLCNDAYRPTLGIKDPWALGAPATRVWTEIWPDIGPRIESVLTTGKATYDEGLLLLLERSGFPEETYHTFSYSPLQDDTGSTAGMLCVVTEETERLISERRVETLRDVASALASTKSEDEVLQTLRLYLGKNPKDLPYSLTFLYDNTGRARLAAAVGLGPQHWLAPPILHPGATSPWPAADMFHQPYPRPVADIEDHAGGSRLAAAPVCGFWNVPVKQAVVVPLRQQAQERPAGFLALGLNPYRRYDSSYLGFIDLLAGQIAAALASAQAYDAERLRAEALAQIDRAKTTFFSNVSHELRTPLTLMLSPVEDLLAQNPVRPGERELLEMVHRNGLRLQRLVNTLLDFSRIEAGRVQAVFEPTDLARYTADLAANFRSTMEKAGLAYHVDCDPVFTQPVFVDRDMWEKIVLNLLSNALKFTFEGSVNVSLADSSGYAVLTVRDTGTGIPPSELPHIFERFHRVAGARGRTIEGTGIGLALVQELVRLHGGSITVSSEVGRGSAFTVRVPLGAAHLPKDRIQATGDLSSTALRSDIFVGEALRWLDLGGPSAADPAAPAILSPSLPAQSDARERVLLADDNPDMREYAGRLLRERYHVTAVSNGAEALRSALANPPDLILSDVMMPVLDGFALLRELRAHPETRTIPVVLVSARAGEESRVEGLGAGADDYLIKPFTAREMLARVAAHLSMNRRRREAEQALKESQATLQSFYDSSPLLMGVVDLTGRELIVVYGNRATAEFIEVDAALLPGATLHSLGVPDRIGDLWISRFQECRHSGRSVQFEYQYPTAAGARWLSARVNFLGLSPSGLPRFSYISEDITGRKEQEALIRRSNEELRRANADLEQFAYSASHDLQEPLRQVAIYSQLFQRRYAANLDGRASEYLGYLVEGAQRMETLIRDLLAYSQAAKTSEPSTDTVDMNEVVEFAEKNLAATIQETRAVIAVAPLPTVRAGRVPLCHVMLNLLSNALKYRGADPPCIHVSAEPGNGLWRFAVRDNGIGIPNQFHTQIFGMFKRLHDRNVYPGTGIGLAICQKVVERYGGRIWVESEEGHGSTFFFTLPSAETNEH
jgi:signal transduction histidine kinase/CheY-like chemotaxis protein